MTSMQQRERSKRADALKLVAVEILKRFPLAERRAIIDELERIELAQYVAGKAVLA